MIHVHGSSHDCPSGSAQINDPNSIGTNKEKNKGSENQNSGDRKGSNIQGSLPRFAGLTDVDAHQQTRVNKSPFSLGVPSSSKTAGRGGLNNLSTTYSSEHGNGSSDRAVPTKNNTDESQSQGQSQKRTEPEDHSHPLAEEVRSEVHALRREMWLMEQRMISAFGEELSKLRADFMLSAIGRRGHFEDNGYHSGSVAAITVTAATDDSNSTGEGVSKATKEREKLAPRANQAHRRLSIHHGLASNDNEPTPNTLSYLQQNIIDTPTSAQKAAMWSMQSADMSRKKREQRTVGGIENYSDSGSLDEVVKSPGDQRKRGKKSIQDYVQCHMWNGQAQDGSQSHEPQVSPSRVRPALRTPQAEVFARQQRRNLENEGMAVSVNPLVSPPRKRSHGIAEHRHGHPGIFNRPAAHSLAEFCNFGPSVAPMAASGLHAHDYSDFMALPGRSSY